MIDLALNDQRRAFSDAFENLILKEKVCYVEIATFNPLSRLNSISIEELKNTPCILVASAEQENEERRFYHDIIGFKGDFLFARTLQEARFMAILATLLGSQEIDEFKAVNMIFEERGIALPLEGQATTTTENRREAGSQVQIDIFGRNNVRNKAELEELLNILSSSIGSLTNPSKLSATFKSVKHTTISKMTIKRYIDYLEDAFLIDSAIRYDIKGKKYIDTPSKYYFTDLGLRNARLNFRQVEETHAMENIIFNELKVRGYNVDVGVVVMNETDQSGKKIRKQLEIDFVCNKGSKRYYIQSAFAMQDEKKMQQEQRPLINTGDGFKKIIITKDAIAPLYNEEGVLVMSIFDFLLNPDSMDL